MRLKSNARDCACWLKTRGHDVVAEAADGYTALAIFQERVPTSRSSMRLSRTCPL